MHDELKPVRSGMWWAGVAGFTFGLCDRSLALLLNPGAEALGLLVVASLFAVFFLFLKPAR